MKEFLNNIRELTEIETPSGREGPVAKVIRKNWEQYGEVCEENLGNLSITIGSGAPHIEFVAHMDEVGFVIRKFDDDGFISLNKLGEIPERVLAGQKLLVMRFKDSGLGSVILGFMHAVGTLKATLYRKLP